MYSKVLIFSVLICVMFHLNAQFARVNIPFPNVYLGAASWADFNHDGHTDIAILGMDSLNIRRTMIFKNNDGSTFTPLVTTFPGLDRGDIEWCDYNNDGLPDLMILGDGDDGKPYTRLFSNNGNETFSEVDFSFTGVRKGSAAWTDYNRDGLQDVVITGENAMTSAATELYKNNGDSTFTLQPGIFMALKHSTAEWNDYNGDGYPDILLTGFDITSSAPYTVIYSNNRNGTFSLLNTGLQGVAYGTARWGDFNNDRYPDIFVSGSYSGLKFYIYRNNGDSSFTNIPVAGMEGLFHCSASVFDFDNDGLTDIFVTGYYGAKAILYKNNGSFSFTGEAISITPAGYASTAVGDFNSDGRQDLLVNGEVTSGGLRKTRLYINHFGAENVLPTKPTNLSASLECDQVVLSWTKGTDNGIPPALLTSAVYIGLTSGTADIVHPGSDLTTGTRWMQEPGNAGADSFMIIRDLRPGTYYWGVQTIDQVNGTSIFSDENSFVIPELPEADAGIDRAVCFGQPFGINESDLVYTPTGMYRWTTTGTGVFDDPALLAPAYTPSYDDLMNGSVTLRFEVLDAYHCLQGTTNEKVMTFTWSTIEIKATSEDYTVICEGLDTALFVNAEGTGLSYQWYKSANGLVWQPIEDAITSRLEITGAAITDDRYYIFVVTDTLGCADTSTTSLQLQVEGYPAVPEISESNDTLISVSQYQQYQWLDEQGNLAGTGNYLLPQIPGVYYLNVTDNNYCWSVSTAYSWILSGSSEINAGNWRVYPNPASEYIMIENDMPFDNAYSVKLYSTDGRVLGSWFFYGERSVIPLEHIPGGVYILEISGSAASKKRVLLNIH